jgi:hypothetical protein
MLYFPNKRQSCIYFSDRESSVDDKGNKGNKSNKGNKGGKVKDGKAG